jgi:hypothetical protein
MQRCSARRVTIRASRTPWVEGFRIKVAGPTEMTRSLALRGLEELPVKTGNQSL